MPPKTKPTASQNRLVYEFKIALLDIEPPIWRRIQVPDCTLDTLHEHIQTAMGWTNSHLHRFEIDGKRYGDPELLVDLWEDGRYADSTTARLNALFVKRLEGIRFLYEYDFGDGWRHEIVYEGTSHAEPTQKYPRCLDGARACPPENVGGPWRYAEFLTAIGDPNHSGHKRLLEWASGSFDPEKFSATQTTRAMQGGLPDWLKSL